MIWEYKYKYILYGLLFKIYLTGMNSLALLNEASFKKGKVGRFFN